jgi:DNA-binding GntR family transcriptional regulator
LAVERQQVYQAMSIETDADVSATPVAAENATYRRLARPSPALPPAASTLPASVAERLRIFITEGKLAAGARLNERVLCAQLGVSRTPLREAFRLLEADGLVVLHPNRGAQVVVLSATDVRESFELMGALEALSGELACRRITDAEINEIKALTFEMLACHARRDLPAYYHRNRQIHDRINLAAGNGQLRLTYASLNLRIQNLRFRSNFDDVKWDRAAAEHARMVAALEARDAPGMASIMRYHLQQKGEAVLEAMRAHPAAGTVAR